MQSQRLWSNCGPMGSVWPVTAVVLEFVIKLGFVAAILLRRRPKSASTLAWIVVILAVPLVGICAYLLVGEVKLGRRRSVRHLQITRRIDAAGRRRSAPPPGTKAEVPADYRHIATLAEAVGDNEPRGGNRLNLVSDTDLFIQSLVEDIDKAKDHCHLLFYIFLDDHSGRRAGEALMRAAKRGVACRVLVDAVGSKQFLESPLREQMEKAGVRVVEAMPVNFVRMLFARIDVRNHRKMAVIDGAVGYVGSHNVADAEFAIKPKYAPWVDAAVRVDGPAVRDLQRLFLADWYLDTDESLEEVLQIEPSVVEQGMTGQVMGTGPNAYNEAMRQLALATFHVAREELILTTPYFVPDEATVTALCAAARRGVETRLVVPGRNDSPIVAAASRSHYETLLEAGVTIHEFQDGLLHAKTMTIDRKLALITTSNLDRRSFELNFEVSMLVYDSDFASQMRFLQTAYVGRSRAVDGEAWARRGWPRRLVQNAAGTLGPLL
ncbi:MAG: cardiolipin synthase [Phycisphaerales bacterium]|nr:MAG: cardiolipin synthase [Phycisphaerales bacterium]